MCTRASYVITGGSCIAFYDMVSRRFSQHTAHGPYVMNENITNQADSSGEEIV